MFYWVEEREEREKGQSEALWKERKERDGWELKREEEREEEKGKEEEMGKREEKRC